ncbi:MAG: hypothetical protein AUK37_03390 [Rhodobacterales bacterium CG2_30_65_12]|nr:MAG: hypothetical protein AUK37_03390 [Rhodobacterales bacterium CG2_30_65_12]
MVDTRHVRFGRPLAVFAGLFGAATLFAGGSVLFGPASAREAAGDIVAFVPWFNFLAGFAYLAAAVGLWRGARWAIGLAWAIAAATALVALAFAFVVLRGTPFEPRTVGALALRTGVWAGIALIASWRKRA